MLSEHDWQGILGGLYTLRHSVRNEIGADVDEKPYLEGLLHDLERVLLVIRARQDAWRAEAEEEDACQT